MKEYLLEKEAVLGQLESDPLRGLSSEKAAELLAKNGQNKLKESKKPSAFKRFLLQLKDPMIIILLVAAAISSLTEYFEATGAGSSFFPTDALIILAVVLLNAILGVVQESKAEAAIEALQKMSAARSRVIRDGRLMTVKSEELVVGDVLVLEAGDAVPADGRLLECASLQIEEAALTGESVPVNKLIGVLCGEEVRDVPLGTRKNMVYMGSTVVYGRGKAVVTHCGMDTEMGKIADAISRTAEDETPLQKKLRQLSKTLSFLVLGISLFIFLYKLGAFFVSGGAAETGELITRVLEAFMVAVSLAVAAIPEGLVAVVTVVLSIGVTNMSKRNAIIRKMTAVETLGCAQIICSDKTGTLTQNKMTVVESYRPCNGLLARAMALCSDAEWEQGQAVGEPTEAALVAYAASLGLEKKDLKRDYPRVAEAPFDSVRKMMSTLHEKDGRVIQYTKGAPDEVLKRCTQVRVDGKVVALTDEKRAEILAANKAMADKALRVLACAYKTHDEIPTDFEPQDIEKDLIFLGLTGMIDPVRPEVKDAIALCKDAGIRAIMITGDHIDTAIAIATELGIITDKSQAITGAEMAEIPDEEFEERIAQYSVYARVQPEHKVRIVTTWKKRGCITAMTGDGVNDAPSIKSADIGIGMGITGTDVTKSAAGMVLQDDNFATIVSAVGEGRRIYDNICKTIQFQLSSNLAEVVSVFIATIFGYTLLRPMHLLWINLITDTFPAIALGMEEGEKDLMKRPPRNDKESIFSHCLGINVFLHGVYIGLLTLAAFFIGVHFGGEEHGVTMAFLTLALTETVHSFNVRSLRHSIFNMKTQNKTLWGAAILSLVLTLSVVFIPPFAAIFDFTVIGWVELAIAVGLALSVLLFSEVTKLIFSRIEKKKGK